MLKSQKFPFRTGIKMRHWCITPLLIDTVTNLTCFFFKVSSRKKNRILFVTRNLRSPFLILLTNSRKCSSHYLCLCLAWCSMGSQFYSCFAENSGSFHLKVRCEIESKKIHIHTQKNSTELYDNISLCVHY